MRGSSPRMTRGLYLYDPGFSRRGMKNAAPRPGNARAARHLAKPLRRGYKRGLHGSNRREICMTIMCSQIAPSRPMLKLDACVAL